MKERILEIRVIPVEGGKYKLLASCGADGKEVTAELDPNVRSAVKKLGTELQRRQSSYNGGSVELTLLSPNRGARGSALGLGSDQRILEELGTKLYSFLFANDISTFYNDNLNEAIQGGGTLRIKLRLDDAPELSGIPWEAVYEEDTRSFIAPQLKVSFTRGVKLPDLQFRNRNCLHILGMIAGPTKFRGATLPRLDVVVEQAKITKAIEPLIPKKKATLSWTLSGNYRDFRRRLHSPDDSENGWTIFHFIGHGDVDAVGGFLIFEEVGGMAGEARYAEVLTPLLTEPPNPQLVVLNSCNGARPSSGDPFSSLAAALVLGGVSAVVAMQFPISDQAAILFSESFYTYLSEGYPIQKAVAQTRVDMIGRRTGEWVSPVLFMRSKNGVVIHE